MTDTRGVPVVADPTTLYCAHCRSKVDKFFFVSSNLAPVSGEKAVAYHMKSVHKAENGYFCLLCRVLPQPFRPIAIHLVKNPQGQIFYKNIGSCTDHLLTFHGLLDMENNKSYVGRVSAPSQPRWKRESATRPFKVANPQYPGIGPHRPPIRQTILDPFISTHGTMKAFLNFHMETLNKFEEMDQLKDVNRITTRLPPNIDYTFETFDFLPRGGFTASFLLFLEDQVAWRKWFDTFQMISHQSWARVGSKSNNYAPGVFRCAHSKGDEFSCPASMDVKFVQQTQFVNDFKCINTIINLRSEHNHKLNIPWESEEGTDPFTISKFFNYFLQGLNPHEANEFHRNRGNVHFPIREKLYSWHFIFSCEKPLFLQILFEEELASLSLENFCGLKGLFGGDRPRYTTSLDQALEEKLARLTRIHFTGRLCQYGPTGRANLQSSNKELCQVCKKLIKRPAQKYHAYSHFEKPLYECPLCSCSEYKSIFGTRRHIDMAHGSPHIQVVNHTEKYQKELNHLFRFCFPSRFNVGEPEEDKPQECVTCEKVVPVKDLMKHAMFHLDAWMVRCPLCDYKSRTSYFNVQRHMRAIHPDSEDNPIDSRDQFKIAAQNMKAACFPRINS